MKKKITVIGGGTAALFFSAFVDTQLFDVTIYESKKSLGRKFLVAGDGGFNLTHSENISELVKRYTPNYFLENALKQFTNLDLINWLENIGIPTFVGTSRRVFPEKGIKPIMVLEKLKEILISKHVKFEFNKTFTGWREDNEIIFDQTEIVKSDIIVFALGGASWKVTGSDGTWAETFKNKGIAVAPFVAQNCAFGVDWDIDFILQNEGSPIKNIAITSHNQKQKGEVVVTKFGIEGNAIYALSNRIQNDLRREGVAKIFIDFKPTLTHENIANKLQHSKYNISQSMKRVLKLSSTQIEMVKNKLTKDEYLDRQVLIKTIKAFPVLIKSAAPINEAISTSGGIPLSLLNNQFELVDHKNMFCIGEMVDWTAPTGGYLIQGCVSMGITLANYLNKSAF